MGKFITVIVTATALFTAASLFYAQLDKATQPDISLQTHSMFTKFVIEHSKVYDTPAEKNFRLKIFKNNLDKIEKIQQRVSHRVGVNKFADLTPTEFKTAYIGYRPLTKRNSKNSIISSSKLGDLPKRVDWRQGNTISPIKNLKTCSADWAFSAIATLEHALTILRRQKDPQANYISLSEQHLIDCDTYQNNGCSGGHFYWAFDFFKSESSAKKGSDYKYRNMEGPCEEKKYKDVLKVDEHYEVEKNSMEHLENAVAKGVVSVAIQVKDEYWSYKGGIIEIGNYKYIPNHASNVVGFDNTGDKHFWILRESWGTKWGENGYARLEKDSNKNKQGALGIQMDASYATVVLDTPSDESLKRIEE